MGKLRDILKTLKIEPVRQRYTEESPFEAVDRMLDKYEQQIREHYLNLLPEEKNFNSEVCMWRDDSAMIKQVRGECLGWNQYHDAVKKRFESEMES